MKKFLLKFTCIFAITGAVVIGSGQSSNCWAVDYTVSTYNEAYAITLLYLGTAGGAITVNGKPISWTAVIPDQVSITVDGTNIGTFNGNDAKGITDAVAEAFGIDLSEIYVGNDSIAGASQQAARIIFNNLIIPSTETRQQKEKTAALKAMKMPRTTGAAIRYEKIVPEYGEDGKVLGLNIGMTWDRDNISYGFMLPYDHIDFDGLLDADRLGGILFGQYNQVVNDKFAANYTAVINYMNTSISYDSGDSGDLNTYGGGLGSSLTYLSDSFESSVGISYMYSKDDSNRVDDAQHLIKIGFNNGFMISDNKVINIFGNWTCDVTDYTYDPNDDDYFQAGIEFKADLTDTWSLSLGVKELLEYSDMDSHEIYLGSIWKF